MVIGLLGLDKEDGIRALMNQFQQGGLGEVFQSWVGTGDNLSISSQQLKSVLGTQLSQQAAMSGVDVSKLAGMIADFLPEMINKATPNGELPVAGQEGDMLHNALQSLLKHDTSAGSLEGLATLLGSTRLRA